MHTIFNTKVAGIPCRCKVLHHTKAIPSQTSGRFEDAEEGSPSEFEFRLLNANKGDTPIKWLEKKVTDDDRERLEDEYKVTLLEEKYDI